MARSRKRDRLRQVARAGLADMPGNAAWVLSRALKPATSAARDSSAGVFRRAAERVRHCLGRGSVRA